MFDRLYRQRHRVRFEFRGHVPNPVPDVVPQPEPRPQPEQPESPPPEIIEPPLPGKQTPVKEPIVPGEPAALRQEAAACGGSFHHDRSPIAAAR